MILKVQSPVAGARVAQNAPQGDASSKFSEFLKRSEIGGLHEQLSSFQKGVLNGQLFSPQELLKFQIQAGQFGLRVELISRVAESASATIRKFQQQG
ncbi:MAG: hypothetical protein KDD64_06340 [Bdellovibrionales bacterium]|nr:hypothetical protein [Bdellovibrionales bacterium]